MSHKSKASTTGYTWLEHSFRAFNGSGYRDETSPDRMIESYINYNKWKKRPEAAALALEFYQALLPLAEDLVENSHGAGKETSQKNLQKFADFVSSKGIKPKTSIALF